MIHVKWDAGGPGPEQEARGDLIEETDFKLVIHVHPQGARLDLPKSMITHRDDGAAPDPPDEP